ncbi:MAG TPA: class I SAM-dependent methyltransferase [Allocoleopsis sp.]
MRFYSRVLLPRLLDWVMSDALFTQYRQQVLATVEGEVLEIGFGTGLNLAHYPASICQITTVDPNPGMQAIAKKRIRASAIDVNYQVLNSESLPMPDHTFDSVVSTWTLCSIANVEQALREIYRVLKPNGKFFFIEHGLSSKPEIQVWQHRLTPLQKLIADGCHLDRNIQALVEQQFDRVELRRFTPDNMPELTTHFYRGIATKTA